ncbi:MAG: DUF6516 family protein [Gallionella sp.]|nr:DUF6516 family protein [Gallionella sp.]
MRTMKATLITHRKLRHAQGKIEMVVWAVPKPIDPSLHAFKYRLVYIVDGVRVVVYDNERGKGDHKHLGALELAYVFVDVPTLIKDFKKDVEKL